MAKTKRPQPEEDIADTLNRLGVADEAEAAGADLLSDVETTSSLEIDDGTNEVSSLEAEEVPIPAQQMQPPRSPLRDALFEQRTTPPAARAARAEPEESLLPFAEVPSNVLPMSLGAVRPPAAGRKVKPEVSPGVSVKKFGAALAKKLPGAEKVMVRKRLEDGSLGYIGEYDARDLAASSNIETFLHKFVKSRYGAGEYHLQAVDAGGNTMDLAPVRLVDPLVQSGENSSVGLLRDIMAQVQAEKEKLSQQQPVNPVGMLRDVMQLQKEVAPPLPPTDNGMGAVIAAMVQSNAQMMQMFMQMQQAQSAQTTQLLTTLFSKREEPASQPLPLPPPPPEFPWEKILAQLPVLLPLLRGSDDTKTVLLHMLTEAKSQTLGPMAMIELFKEMRPVQNGSDDFRKTIENLSGLQQILNQMRANQEPQSASFFDALGALFTNPDFVGSIGAFIRKGAESSQLKAQVQARKELTATHVQAQRALVQAGIPITTPPPAPAVPPEVQRAIPATPQPAQASAPAAAQPAAPAQPAASPQLPPIPENIGEHINAMVEATNEGDRIQAAIAMFYEYGSKYSEWQPLVQKLLMSTHSGDEKAALTLLSQVFRGFIAMNLLTPESAEKIFEAFEKNFAQLVDYVRGLRNKQQATDPREDPFGAALEQPPEGDDPEEGSEESEEGSEESEEGSEESEEGEESEEDLEGDEEEDPDDGLDEESEESDASSLLPTI